MNILPSGQKLAININDDPTHNLDINGNVRIRVVASEVAPNALIVGKQVNNSGDLEVKRLDFTGNANQVLLGDGTWGAAPSNANPHNVLSVSSVSPNSIALGQNIGAVLNPARLLNDREVPLNTHVLRFSTTTAGQAGQVVTGNYGGPYQIHVL